MTRQSRGLMLSPVLILGLTAATAPLPGGAPHSNDTVLTASSLHAGDTNSVVQAKGRYKKQGNNCVWDGTDGGPDQCTPQTKGRFKKGGDDSCTWDANDVGADQCRPPKGRWKKGGDNSCTWDANDGGPDQCNPRQAR
jgi:hypothetical protein